MVSSNLQACHQRHTELGTPAGSSVLDKKCADPVSRAATALMAGWNAPPALSDSKQQQTTPNKILSTEIT